MKLVYKFQADNHVTSATHIQNDLNALAIWSSLSGLEFSVDKSSVMILRCPLPFPPLKLGEITIPVASEIRDLGIRYNCAFSLMSQPPWLGYYNKLNVNVYPPDVYVIVSFNRH